MKNLDKVTSWYETLSKASLTKINSVYTKDTFFKDPFNEFYGSDKIERIFKDMFDKMENPRFVFIDKFEEGAQAFTTWDFLFSLKGTSYKIHGSSHLKFNSDGLIIYHRDYWDVGEELLLKIPVVKSLYGMLRKKIGSH